MTQEAIEHLQRMMERQRWPEALACLETHQSEIDQLPVRQKADLLNLMYGKRGKYGEWRCDLALLDRMLDLNTPVDTNGICAAFGPQLFDWSRGQGGVYRRNEDDRLTPLKLQVLERLDAQIERAGVIYPGDDQAYSVSDDTFADFQANIGGGPFSPVRLELFDLIIKVFNVSFNQGSHNVDLLNWEITNGEGPPRFVQLLARRGKIDWTVQVDSNKTREEWVKAQAEAINTQAKETPGDKRIRSLYKLTQASKMEALAAARHNRLGAGSTLPLPSDVLKHLQGF